MRGVESSEGRADSTPTLPSRGQVPHGFELRHVEEIVEGLPLRRFLFEGGRADPARAAVLVPGLAASGRSFARQAPLAREFDLRPLTGPLAVPFPGNPIDTLADVIGTYLQRLEKPVLLGTSFGSLVAITVAARLQDKLSGLALVSALATGRMVPRRYAAFAGAMLAPRPLAWMAAPVAARVLGGGDLDAAAHKEIVRESRLVDSGEMFRRVNAVLSTHLIDELPKLRLPVLLVHGSRDRIIPSRAARRMAERLPDCRWVEMEGAGHLPYLSHPARFNEIFGDFLRSVLPARG